MSLVRATRYLQALFCVALPFSVPAKLYAADIIPFPKQSNQPEKPAPETCESEVLTSLQKAFKNFHVPHLGFPQIQRLLELGRTAPLSTGRAVMIKGPHYAGKADFMRMYANYLRMESHPFIFLNQTSPLRIQISQNMGLTVEASSEFTQEQIEIISARKRYMDFRTGGSFETAMRKYIEMLMEYGADNQLAAGTFINWSENPLWSSFRDRTRTSNLREYERLLAQLNHQPLQAQAPVILMSFAWSTADDFEMTAAELKPVLRQLIELAVRMRRIGGVVVFTYPTPLAQVFEDPDIIPLLSMIEVIDFPLILDDRGI